MNISRIEQRLERLEKMLTDQQLEDARKEGEECARKKYEAQKQKILRGIFEVLKAFVAPVVSAIVTCWILRS